MKLRQATNKDLDTITMIFRKSFTKTIHDFEFPNFDNISEMHISERLSDGSLYAFENGTAAVTYIDDLAAWCNIAFNGTTG